jgi:hypothetical protein
MHKYIPTNWTCQGRIDNYVRETGYPRSLFVSEDGRIVGTWIMGNSYRRDDDTLYGSYPHGYLRRVKALFPEKHKVLHVFSGKVSLGYLPGDTVDTDITHDPTFVDNAQTLLNVPLHKYDLVLADPPYSVEDCEHYQCTMIRRNLVMRALQRTKPGTHIVWLDQVLPMYKKEYYKIIGVIGMVKSTNHRFRMIIIFERI